jgi:putative peptide maturation dehydrogenase
VGELAQEGLLLTDADDPQLAELRRRDEQLEGGQWGPYAALYHAVTRWRGADLALEDGDFAAIAAEAEQAVSDFVRRHGPPPHHFHSVADPIRVVELPLVEKRGGLYDVLARRRTTRGFDPARAATTEQLALLLRCVYGCHGYAPLYRDILALKRTSPSAGGLHPTEVYPLVRKVAGLASGLYHYDARNHALELIEEATEDKAGRLIGEFTAGQIYFSSAAVAFVMTARFSRSFWKYRGQERAYAAVLMDAAHLSQTLYLVCAELGLGAFVTTAINAAHIDERLDLDGFEEGAVAVCGCGVPLDGSSLDPTFFPYVPRETAL